MSDLYSNDKIREMAEKIVREDVYYCASALIDGLNKIIYSLNHQQQQDLGVDDEDLRDVSTQNDWVTPAEDWIDNADAAELRDVCEYLDVEDHRELPPAPEEDEHGNTPEEDAAPLREALRYALEQDGDLAEKLCDYQRLDSETNEAYEHWIVSSWLARKLAAKGEMVGEVAGLTIWGRCTTGQTISMDWVVLCIAKELIENN